MATYIILINYTQQGIQKIKESPVRLDAAKKLFKSMGAELKQWLLVMGRYDAAVIAEAPNDETVAKLALAVGSLGAVQTETLRAFTEDEYRKIIAALPWLGDYWQIQKMRMHTHRFSALCLREVGEGGDTRRWSSEASKGLKISRWGCRPVCLFLIRRLESISFLTLTSNLLEEVMRRSFRKDTIRSPKEVDIPLGVYFWDISKN
jgi:uncharacterized protein with GYD domain